MEKSKDQKPIRAFKATLIEKVKSNQISTKHAQRVPEDSKLGEVKKSDLIKSIEFQLSKNRDEIIEVIKILKATK